VNNFYKFVFKGFWFYFYTKTLGVIC